MELLKGESAAALLERQGRFSAQDAAALVFQVCNALESAHAAGIVHRDLKVANVFLQRADAHTTRIRVLDFGIAKLLDNERLLAAETLTRSGVLLGTPQYMAPEQIEGRPVDRRADLYGLGALFYECLTGRPPYGTDVPHQRILLDILTKPPPRPSTLLPSLPPAIDDLVASLMKRLPAERPASAAEVQARLLAIYPDLQDYRPRFVRPRDSEGPHPRKRSDAPVVTATRTRSSAPSPSKPPARPKTLLGFAIGATALVLLFVAAWSYSKTRAPAAAHAALLQRGRIAIADGAPALAVELAHGAIEEDATDAQGWLLLGAAYEALQDRAAAREAYRGCAAKAKGPRAGECSKLANR
jgi:serine/threonine protein kinase